MQHTARTATIILEVDLKGSHNSRFYTELNLQNQYLTEIRIDFALQVMTRP